MKISVLGALMMVIATTGCVTPIARGPEDQRLDVSEAVLRHMFQNYRGGARNPVTYCVGVREQYPGLVTDAPHELIMRLKNISPVVKPYAACLSRMEVLDAGSGRAGVIFHVGPIECPAPNRCTAMAAYSDASLSGVASEFEVVRRGGNWIVISQELFAVS